MSPDQFCVFILMMFRRGGKKRRCGEMKTWVRK